MFVLQIISGPYKGQAIQLMFDHPLTVGRSPTCNVRLDDAHLSAAHAEVLWNDDGFSVFDLNSVNGTLLNGQKTAGRTPIRLGDHIQVGGVIFHLREVDVTTDEPLDLIEAKAGPRMLAFDAGKTKVQMRAVVPVAKTAAIQQLPKSKPAPQIMGDRALRTTMREGVASANLDAEAISGAAALKQRVDAGGSGAAVLVQHTDRMDPFWSTPVSIGRELSSGIVLEDRAVSLRHAVIDRRDGQYLVRDVGSSNGVYVNRRRVVEHVLQDGDIISIGSHTIVVVLGDACLGLSLQPPTMTDDLQSSAPAIGVVAEPLAKKDAPKKKKPRKKASELVWYATSDLDRGGFRARAALLALLFGMGLTVWMLAKGDSEILVGRRLAKHHEGEKFVTMAEKSGLDRCTACHVGAGQISTLKCLDCHPYSRPLEGHVSSNVDCDGCHFEHRGSDFLAASSATFSCGGCHPNPHDELARTRPQLVATFDRTAPGDVEFHLTHVAQDVPCLVCHEGVTEAAPDRIREACGQCHAPDNPVAADCQFCHGGHPDRVSRARFEETAVVKPPRFAAKGVVWTMVLLVLSFLIAAMIPRRRKVTIEAAETEI